MAPRPRVEIEGTQAHGVIRGRTTPGASVEAMNASLSPAERVRPHEGVVIARADERGRFAGKLPIRADDVVCVRARSANGAAGPWTTFRALGVGGEPRRPNVALFRIGLRDLEDGLVKIFNLSPKRPLAEPGAEVVVVNTRNEERVAMVMNARGTIAGRARIVGRAGDVLRVEAKGRGVGTLTTPSAKPPRGLLAPSGWHRKIGFVPDARPYVAPLFVGRPHPFDVVQSELSNCYLASAAAAIAHVRPDLIERAITRLQDGRFRVRFRLGREYRPHDVVVTSELYVRPSGELLYGTSKNSTSWWPVLEKAFAALRGSYRRVGRGGTSHRVFELLLGRPPRHFFLVSGEAQAAWERIAVALAAKLPVVAGTSPPWTAKKFHLSGIAADHAYSVLGCRPGYLTVRNPWGEDVGPPERPRKNGAFEITVEELGRYFQVVSTVR
jgi:hypothetical protein